VTIHGELVHNRQVLVQLQGQGFALSSEHDRSTPETSAVLITAHGISDRERRRLESSGKRLIDTTCPLVRRVHQTARDLDRRGYHVLVVGRRDHVEVRGIVEDLQSYDVIETPQEVKVYPYQRLAIVCQTTTPPSLAQSIRDAVGSLNPYVELRFADTICQPTRDRQEAVDRLLEQVDVMVVVGGSNSNNTLRLVERCRAARIPVWHVQSAADVDVRWFDGLETVGLTAGTSTLEATIDDVYRTLHQIRPGRPRTPETSAQWCDYFRRNRENLLAIHWNDGPQLTADERKAIARSVQAFQLGETGRGSHLTREAQKHAEEVHDPQYVESLRLFLAEEQRHAADLGRFLDLEGIPRLKREWTNNVFRRVRKLAGLEPMLVALLTAELIAVVYYAALRHATASSILRAICRQILHDEVRHVQYQCQRLAVIRRNRRRWLKELSWLAQSLFYYATCLIVWMTHMAAFRAAGMSFAHFRCRARRELTKARRATG
jgi:(E)-4-hydroxy-3-methyl-but-2-enyl pyrophosphate reductase